MISKRRCHVGSDRKAGDAPEGLAFGLVDFPGNQDCFCDDREASGLGRQAILAPLKGHE